MNDIEKRYAEILKRLKEINEAADRQEADQELKAEGYDLMREAFRVAGELFVS